MNSYSQHYVDDCRTNIATQVSAYRNLIAAAGATKGNGESPLSPAIASFEPLFFNNMVIVLDALFCHRSRTLEGKDGNPLNEVRVLCNSLMLHDGQVCAEKSIKLNSSASVLKLQVGDAARLNEDDFQALADAFFTEIESKYV